jgi:thiol:disulfide interchange protein DsbD
MTAAIRRRIWLTATLLLLVLTAVRANSVNAELSEPGPATYLEQSQQETTQTGAVSSQSRVQRFQAAVERGLFWMYLVAFLAGIATSLTPCVLPIIPLTIAVIGAKTVESRMKGFALSLVYVLGIAVTYSTLGVAFASTGTLLGSQFQSKPFLLFFVLIFTLLALGLFGAYQLQLPASIRNRLLAKHGKGWFGILFMGLIAGLVASPCAGPIVAGILLFIADTENGLGIALLVVAFYYLSLLLDTFPFVLILGATLVVGGGFLGAFTRLDTDDKGWFPRTRKAIGVLVVAAGLYFFVGGLMTYGLLLPPMGGIGSGTATRSPAGQVLEGLSSESVGVAWNDDLEAALFLAEMDRKLVMVDFTADWCIECRELDHSTFSDPDVIEEFKKFILVRIDLTDEADPKNEEFRRRYSILSLPSVTFLTPSGEMLPDFTLRGFIRAPEFLEILQGVLEASKNLL